MDDIVQQAMAKWPQVPHCYGWLALDARGHWHLRDADAQAAGSFDSGNPGSKGSLLQHDKLIGFIHRNYAHDDRGQWYFQNGPQRVYVELEVTPWVWRVEHDFSLRAQTGLLTSCSVCLLDERGWVYADTPLGLGLVHTLDTECVAHAVESGRWKVNDCERDALATRFGYVRSPAAQVFKLLQK